MDSGYYSVLKIKSGGCTDTLPAEVNRLRWKATLTGVRGNVDVKRRKNEKISDEKLLKIASRCEMLFQMLHFLCGWSTETLSTLICIVF